MKGKIYLVGAGPGNADLITVKGAELIRRAEVLVYDWLVNPELLELAPGAKKIYVGKKGGTQYKKQSEINGILLKEAQTAKRIVRLKGGDPFVFGRGGEEASFLAKRKIPFEVVPGVSAGHAVPAYAGIPVTDRRWASQVTFVTGHEDPGKKSSRMDWKTLADNPGTLVFFMGVKTLPLIVKGLIENGKSPRTKAAVIERGASPEQRVITGTLSDIVRKCKKASVGSPALTVIGKVVSLRKRLNWFDRKPLRGKSVLVTRARAQASGLVHRLKDLGAQVLEFPVIEIDPPEHPERIDAAIGEMENFDWIVFTSVNGVASFFQRLNTLGYDARIFAGRKIAAVGEATAAGLLEKGVKADLVPAEFTTQGLVETFRKKSQIKGKNFLLFRADIAPPDLREGLAKGGAAKIREVEAYRTRKVTENKVGAYCTSQSSGGRPLRHLAPRGWRGNTPLQALLVNGKIDYVTFTSSSTVRNFFDSFPAKKALKTRFVSIGPVTSRTLKERGFKPFREAKLHTIDGLVETLIQVPR